MLEDDTLPLDCKKFEHVIDCSAAMQHLASGSSGQAWLVKEKVSGLEVVLKVLFDVLAHPPVYVSAADLATTNQRMRDVVEEAWFECEYARRFAKAGKHVSVSRKGPKRVMQCYGHNLPSPSGTPPGVSPPNSTDTTPLFLLLEYCGGETVFELYRDGMEQGWLTLTIITKAIKQILEGLAYLQSFKRNVYIHHDLKPENIAVRETEDGELALTLIDFGAMVNYQKEGGDERAACHITTSTTGLAPHEWRNPLPGRNACREYNFDPSAPGGFDMFAVAAMLLHFLSDYRLTDLMPLMSFLLFDEKDKSKLWADEEDSLLNFNYIWRAASHKLFLGELIYFLLQDPQAEPATILIVKELRDNEIARSFVQLVLRCFAVNAKERPLAHELLKHPFLVGVKTP